MLEKKIYSLWNGEGFIFSLLRVIILPLSWLYYSLIIVHRRISCIFSPIQEYNINIICVGNAIVGGSGKTPVAIEIAKYFKNKGLNPVFLTRGYKGKYKTEFHKVKNGFDSPFLVGDEALLLSQFADCFVSKNRAKTIRYLESLDYDLVILDDGLQNETIKKNCNILVIDGTYNLFKSFLFPAGRLRESLSYSIYKSDICCLIGKDVHNLKEKVRNVKNDIEILEAFVKPVSHQNDFNHKNGYIAFSAIANNERFFSFLREELCLNLVNAISFHDHYFYKDNDIEKILREAEKKNLKIVTTEKDFIKIKKEFQSQIQVVKIKINFSEELQYCKNLNKDVS